MSKIFADLTPLRDRTFRRFWVSGMLSSVGNQMTNFAVILQVYRLTHSTFAVGAVGLAAAFPAIGIGLLGGVLIDAFDRRRLVLVTSAALTLASLLFTAQAAGGSRALWLFRATRRTRPRSLDTPGPALRPGRASPAVFPSGRPLPSTTSAPATAGLFGDFTGNTGLSDFS